MDVVPRLAQVRRRPDEVRTPGPRVEGARRIVLARLDRLGDVVLSLPAVEAVRRTYPEASLALMVRPLLEPLARMVEGIDSVLVARDNREPLRRCLVEFEADLVIGVSRGAALPRSAVAAGVRYRIGTGHRLYSPLFTRRVNERRSAGARHELEYALSFAHRVGAPPGPERFPLCVPEAAEAEVDLRLAAHGVGEPFVLIHPGTGGSCPPWPARHFAALAELLMRSGREVVFSVGPSDAATAAAVDAGSEHLRSAPRLASGIAELAALARRAAVVVSNSTGPLHLAAAIGTPTLGFYAPWPTCSVQRWGPYAANGWALVADHSEARGWPARRRRREGQSLLAGIRPEQALEALIQLPGLRI